MSFDDLNQKIQLAAKRLFKENLVDVVIGYKQGTTPLTVAPIFCRNEDDCSLLVWSNFAKVNLATYLPKLPGRVGLVAKGCDARSAVGQVLERQIKREDLYIIGVACTGMVDTDLIAAKEPRAVFSAEEDAKTIKLQGPDWSANLTKEEVLRRNCQTCACRTPSDIANEIIGENVPPTAGDDFSDLKEILSKSPAEKLAYFKDLLKDCWRCYACRNACPLCYCPVCFVDETRPQWLGKSQDEMDILTFHLLRAFHCAGRCTACGACESACPMSIKLREFNRILEQEVQKDWNYLPGLSWEQKPPLSTYRPDDQADFIK